MIGIRWILRSLCSLRMTQSGGFVTLNKVKNPFGNSLIMQQNTCPKPGSLSLSVHALDFLDRNQSFSFSSFDLVTAPETDSSIGDTFFIDNSLAILLVMPGRLQSVRYPTVRRPILGTNITKANRSTDSYRWH
jgi:hypothetical protein